eukprot:SAG31_NODE_1172_length_9556_cov_42.164111_1_plen_242_part_00
MSSRCFVLTNCLNNWHLLRVCLNRPLFLSSCLKSRLFRVSLDLEDKSSAIPARPVGGGGGGAGGRLLSFHFEASVESGGGFRKVAAGFRESSSAMEFRGGSALCWSSPPSIGSAGLGGALAPKFLQSQPEQVSVMVCCASRGKQQYAFVKLPIPTEAMRAELSALKLTPQRKRALGAGVEVVQIEEAEDGDTPKQSLIKLLVQAECEVGTTCLASNAVDLSNTAVHRTPITAELPPARSDE